MQRPDHYFKDLANPGKMSYTLFAGDAIPKGVIVAVVKFGALEDSERGIQPNNFVLTAYQVFIYGGR
ncbi:MAG: hypothetical protein HYW07_07305 [Candidatus Latescibacteria bacterium]|nr:hypothetical protein [Candidatus Latescibacterota bacterium]